MSGSSATPGGALQPGHVIGRSEYVAPPPIGSLMQDSDDGTWLCRNLDGVWVDECSSLYSSWRELRERYSPLTVVRWGLPTQAVGQILTDHDPEPPAGSIVEDSYGSRRVRDSGLPGYWEDMQHPRQTTQLWGGIAGLGMDDRGPVKVIHWGTPATEEIAIMADQVPQDAPPATVEADTVRLLTMIGSLDLAHLADVFEAFDDWSEDRVHECVKFAIRCVEEPSKVGQERSIRDFKVAWTAFTDTLKPIFNK
jgi:hypothetical protein